MKPAKAAPIVFPKGFPKSAEDYLRSMGVLPVSLEVRYTSRTVAFENRFHQIQGPPIIHLFVKDVPLGVGEDWAAFVVSGCSWNPNKYKIDLRVKALEHKGGILRATGVFPVSVDGDHMILCVDSLYEETGERLSPAMLHKLSKLKSSARGKKPIPKEASP